MDTGSLAGSSATQSTSLETDLALGKNGASQPASKGKELVEGKTLGRSGVRLSCVGPVVPLSHAMNLGRLP